MGLNPIPPSAARVPRSVPPEPTPDELMAGNLHYLREKYAIGFITLEELEEGLESVLQGGPVNVPRARIVA